MVSDLREEWLDFVGQRLAPHALPLVAVLRRLIEQPYPPEVASLDFELFPDGFTEGFPARAFFMDERNSEVFVERDGGLHYPGSVDPELIEIDSIWTLEEEEDFLERDGGEEISDDLWECATLVFLEWFEACWIRAGGVDFPLRAALMPHDDPDAMRLLPTAAG